MSTTADLEQPAIASPEALVTMGQPAIASPEALVPMDQPTVALEQPAIASPAALVTMGQPARASPEALVPMGQPAIASPAGQPRIRKRVDINVMKRNMSVAKGFMDISLMTANGNQLRNIINSGDPNHESYYIVLTGIIFSLIIQVATGVLLIVKEQFDLNVEDEQEWSERLNNITVCMVFLVVVINVFVSSFGVTMYSQPQ